MQSNKLGNKKARKRILIESFIALLIMASPFLFKAHEYVSSEDGTAFSVFGINIQAEGFDSAEHFLWFILGKLVPFYLLLIWFFTCKHWWYHIILIPVTMYAFQIFETYYYTDILDSQNVLWLLPVCMVLIPVVYLIRIKLYDKHVHGIDLKAMNEELTVLREKEELRKEKEKLEKRKERLKNMGGVGIDAFEADDLGPAGSTESPDVLPVPTGNYELTAELPEEIKAVAQKQVKIQEQKQSEEAEKAKDAPANLVVAENEVVNSSSSKTLRETRQERRRRLAREREQAKQDSEEQSEEEDSEKSEKDHGLAKKM